MFGEPVAVLLRELAAHTGEAELLDDGMCRLSLTVPPRLGGALRRAILRATAVELRRTADEVRDSFDGLDQHELEAAAVLRVASSVTRAARDEGRSTRSLQERALLWGTLTPVPRRYDQGSIER